MRANYQLVSIAALFALAVFISGCKKYLEIEPAPNLSNSEKIFTSDGTALSAMNGIYVQMRQLNNSMTNGGLSLFTGLSGDELYNTAASTTYDPFFRDSIPAENTTVLRNFWAEAYATIYKTNSVIEGLQKSSGLTESVKRQLLGEAKTVRSLYYFYLINLFGDVPLVLATDYEINEKMPRTSSASVYQQITNDLLDAENLLTVAYPSAGKLRPNKQTATALLARVYLFQKNWTQAEAKASAVINGSYSLAPNLANVFLKNSTETIWEVAAVNDASNTAEGIAFIPSSATLRPVFALAPSLANSFEVNDQRRLQWTKANTVSGVSYPYPFKYKSRTNTAITEYNVVLRLAEQYLIRSEAKAQQGNLTEGLADLNVIRTRALLPGTTVTTQSALLNAIEQERRIELFVEWGHRWLDLKRTARIDAVLSAQKPFWKNFASLYPIPFTQLQLNPFLTQNPGY